MEQVFGKSTGATIGRFMVLFLLTAYVLSVLFVDWTLNLKSMVQYEISHL